jgi:DNA-binding NtrC family response regulator
MARGRSRVPEATTHDLEPVTANERGPRVLRVLGQGASRTLPLPRTGTITIGRAVDADVRIDDPSISRRHAVLHIGPPLRVEDLGSKNGIRVGDRRLAPGGTVELTDDALVDLGPVLLIVQAAGAARRPRPLWAHGYFQARLEDECRRTERTGASFAIARIHTGDALTDDELGELLASHLAPLDMAALYAPGELELLLEGLTPADATNVITRVGDEVRARGGSPRAGIACYPQDGRTGEALLAAACAALRSPDHHDRGAFEGAGAAMRKIHALAERAASGRIHVLLLGETGVGKEVFAELLHRRSPRERAPFTKINCAAFSESLLESELFGHEKGAFTGAAQAKPGLLEVSDGGTVLLDEVGDLPLALQAKLLRVLEERQVRRVGGVKSHAIDVRFVAATNRDLEADIPAGRFRRDLYFRLNGIAIAIPPLRERRDEIEPLARRFVEEAARELGRPRPPLLSPEVLELLGRHDWPGNIRELRNVIERAVLLDSGDRLTVEHFPVERMQPAPAARPASTDEGIAMRALSADELADRERVLAALARCAGNQTQAARRLGLSRTAFLSRLDKYGLPRPRKP